MPRTRRGIFYAAPLIRGRPKHRVWNDPGSASQRKERCDAPVKKAISEVRRLKVLSAFERDTHP
jgi:hypothetical protein